MDGILYTHRTLLYPAANQIKVQKRYERKEQKNKNSVIISDCTNCLACVEACPEKAIVVEQGNLEFHEKAAGTFVKMEGGTNPHAHD